MSTNLVISTANFTATDAILAYKEGWTVAYSSMIMSNTGYNRDSIERHHALADQIAYGADPAPSALGTAQSERIGGQRTFYYSVASGGAPVIVVLDELIDWRDRLIMGIVLSISGGGYLPGGANDANIKDPGGSMNSNIFGWYSETGQPAKCTFLAGDLNHYIYADSATGYLSLYIEASVSSYEVNVNMTYSPMLGKMDVT